MTTELKRAIFDFLVSIRDNECFHPDWRNQAGKVWNMMYHEDAALVNEKDEAPITRRSILEDAIKFITKDRNVAHGEPEDSFKYIAAYWDDYLSNRVKRHDCRTMIDSVDVAIMMVLFKVARLTHSPDNPDNWTDIAGYSGCGGEIACKKKPSPSNAPSATKSAVAGIDLTTPI